MGMVNQVAGEHQEKDSNDGSGSARVEDICGGEYVAFNASVILS